MRILRQREYHPKPEIAVLKSRRKVKKKMLLNSEAKTDKIKLHGKDRVKKKKDK